MNHTDHTEQQLIEPAVLVLWLLMTVPLAAQQLPALNWEPRSDWINMLELRDTARATLLENMGQGMDAMNCRREPWARWPKHWMTCARLGTADLTLNF